MNDRRWMLWAPWVVLAALAGFGFVIRARLEPIVAGMVYWFLWATFIVLGAALWESLRGKGEGESGKGEEGSGARQILRRWLWPTGAGLALTTITRNDQLLCTYGYGAAGRRIRKALANHTWTDYRYDAAGRRIGKALANNTSTSYSYDNAGHVLSIAHSNSTGVFGSFEYGYNAVGNRTWVKRENGKGDVYSYDPTDQLVGVQYNTDSPDTAPANPERTVSYVYDPVGNRVSVTDSASPTPLTTYQSNNLNQYTTVGGEPLGYDANGNLTSHNGWSYSYDPQNRLTSASSAQSVVQMSYDARNRCVSRTVNGTTTFLFYESWNLIEERDGSGAEIARYVHGAQIDEMVTLTARPSTLNQIYSYHHDSLGSVTHLTDLSGAVVERYIYDVFGALAILGPQCAALATSAVGNRVLFTGREYLEGIGCYDYRQRTYLPVLGRLLQTDPSRFVGGDVNWYRYVVNDAASLRDPFGLWPWDTYNEVVGSEAFQAGTGWKPTSFSLKTSVEQNFMAWVEGFAMKFEAEVCVSCQCGSKTKRACGKRVACLDESFDQRDQFPTRANRPLPFEIPTSIGELLGELLDQVLPTLTVLEPENLQFIGAQIRHKMPRQAADGAWEGGKSPCSKLWW